ncbi:MAG: hypothetical protein CO029_00400 [Candidatus Magasanikbacteria bacterium CG_4_9_14_0_2_um_filter_41_10]|uniref:HTH arsR-type domain-containing protein n=1 Tax=Candidatus Magasanikbacteria bacterium CG_4_10_14_0_2_um_filter_41_31 TaxID=1974639 RepID=A0A2M7V3B6_9BACT|nr:MAG: hypothetical protein AUJ37_04815 [Candidatus Magasanikbacteria bacterium CG1_02_41_34]PIZ92963.1 MAG: hypothetical protein COX83_03130 [Candidatus Magasanikbacteria bacterium CG_4_10_14_0_2_um_filter_41_31]PJC53899.1 MAG: hypothetical protein CO029_00400 [Candidatus Magasanikbacteria bacterium CG_4_9_14_0_2_um_filter_41_10]
MPLTHVCTQLKNAIRMLEHLFGSKTRYRLLRFFFHNTEKSFFVRELTRALDVQINAIRRELELLVKSTLVEETDAPGHVDQTKAGASLRKYYRLNLGSLMYPEMQALLMKAQLLDEQVFVDSIRESCGDIKLLLLTGRFAGEKDVQTDMLIVGDIKSRNLEKVIASYEKDIGFSIRYTTLTVDELYERRHMMDKFIYSIFEAKHMRVVDELDL